MGVFGQADGSAYLEQGNTKVYGPHDISRDTRLQQQHDRVVVNCQYSMAVFSTSSSVSQSVNTRVASVSHFTSILLSEIIGA